MKHFPYFLFVLTALMLSPLASGASEVTIIYNGIASKVVETLAREKDLWLTLPTLTRATGFILKPQGACLDELCIPIPKTRKNAFLRKERGTDWFNLAQLARTLHQPLVHDAQSSVWVFGAWPEAQMKPLKTLEAPNFTLPDWKGVRRSLTDFRGKKVLLVTWASW